MRRSVWRGKSRSAVVRSFQIVRRGSCSIIQRHSQYGELLQRGFRTRWGQTKRTEANLSRQDNLSRPFGKCGQIRSICPAFSPAITDSTIELEPRTPPRVPRGAPRYLFNKNRMCYGHHLGSEKWESLLTSPSVSVTPLLTGGIAFETILLHRGCESCTVSRSSPRYPEFRENAASPELDRPTRLSHARGCDTTKSRTL